MLSERQIKMYIYRLGEERKGELKRKIQSGLVVAMVENRSVDYTMLHFVSRLLNGEKGGRVRLEVLW